MDSSLKLKPFSFLIKSTSQNYSGSHFFSPNSRLSSTHFAFTPFCISFHFHSITAFDLDCITTIATTALSSCRHGTFPLIPVHADRIQDRSFNPCLHPWRLSSKVLASSGSFCSVTLPATVEYDG